MGTARDGGRVEKARSVWQRAAGGENHDAARSYFKARGIPLEALPGGVLPDCLRYVEILPYWQQRDGAEGMDQLEDGPAILARVDAPDGLFVTIHRTYLDVGGEPKKRAGVEAKKLFGPTKRGAIRLSSSNDGGVLVLTEGVETGLAVLAALPSVSVWSCISATGLRTLDIPPGLVEPANGVIDSVVIAADRDRSDAGRDAAVRAAASFRSKFPNVNVYIAMPSAQDAPTLFDEDGLLPEGVKGVDWLDVLNAGGLAAVSAGLLKAKKYLDVQRPEDAPELGEEKAEQGPEPLPQGEYDRAIIVLEEMFPPRDAREEGRWLLGFWGGDWWVYSYARRCWRAVFKEQLVGQIHHFLADKKTYGKGGTVKALVPTVRLVEGILNAMKADTWISSDVMPAWLPRTFTATGEPQLGAASHLDWEEASGPVSPGAIVAARNGLMDVDAFARDKLVIHKHTPRWFTRSSLPFDLPVEDLKNAMADDADAEALCQRLCPTWLKFLDSVTEGQPDPEAWIRCLRQWFGYFLVHDNSLEAILALIGPPRSGKGTILRAIEVIVGRDGCVPTSLNDLAEKYELSMLVGKAVAIMGDAHVGQKTDAVRAVEMLKGISGGDAFSTEEKYKAKIPNVRPKCRFVLCANTLPKLPDPSGALASRLTVLTMHKSWLGAEDRTLKPRVLAEAAGIMVWALFGLRDLRKEGRFVSTKEGTDTLLEFARLNAPVMSFIQDCCDVDPKNECVTKDLYELYGAWCKEHGYKHESTMPTFGAQLRAACPSVRKAERQQTKKVDEEDKVVKRWQVYIGIQPTAAALEAAQEEQAYVPGQGRLGGLP